MPVPAPAPEGARLSRGMLVILVALLVIVAAVAMVFIYEGNNHVARTDWAYGMVQLDEAASQGLTGHGVRVGIVDTGIDTTHPALKGVRIVAWHDFVAGRPEPYDDEGHGTAMASIIAGRGPLKGGAVDVELVVVKVVSSQGTSDDALIADGIDFCLDPNHDGNYADGADVISLSLGGRLEPWQYLIGSKTQDAVSEAVAHGVYIVAAAGNNDDSTNDVSTPGDIRDVICVGAVDENGQVASFSSRGRNTILNQDVRHDPDKKPEVVAPGVDITTAYIKGEYATGSGTSQATAFVTASLAAALSGNQGMLHDGALGGDRDAVVAMKDALMRSAEKVDGQHLPHDDHAGYGIVQAVALSQALAS